MIWLEVVMWQSQCQLVSHTELSECGDWDSIMVNGEKAVSEHNGGNRERLEVPPGAHCRYECRKVAAGHA